MGREMLGKERNEIGESKVTEGFEGQNNQLVLDIGIP